MGSHCYLYAIPNTGKRAHLNPIDKQAGIGLLDLPALEGWRADLTLVVGYMPRWFT